jgi:membrane protein YdbS with pleckstrin-like domain
MDSDDLVELLPHYLAMFLLLFVVIFAVRTLVGDLGFWIELAIVFVVAFGYRPVVVNLGYAPDVWERE